MSRNDYWTGDVPGHCSTLDSAPYGKDAESFMERKVASRRRRGSSEYMFGDISHRFGLHTSGSYLSGPAVLAP